MQSIKQITRFQFEFEMKIGGRVDEHQTHFVDFACIVSSKKKTYCYWKSDIVVYSITPHEDK